MLFSCLIHWMCTVGFGLKKIQFCITVELRWTGGLDDVQWFLLIFCLFEGGIIHYAASGRSNIWPEDPSHMFLWHWVLCDICHPGRWLELVQETTPTGGVTVTSMTSLHPHTLDWLHVTWALSMMCQDGKAHTTCNLQHWAGTKHPVGLSDETTADMSKGTIEDGHARSFHI